MKRINIRESLLKMDRETDCRYDLTSLYEAVRLDDEKKSKLVKYIDAYDIDATNKLLSNEAEAEGLMENTSDDISDEELSKVVGEAFVHMTDDTTYNPLVTTQSLKVGESVYDEATGNKWTVVNKVENGRWQCEVTFRDETTQEEFVRYAGNNALWELAVEGDTTYEVDDDIELEFHPIDELTANMHEAVPAAVMALGAAAATGFGQSLGDKVGSKLLGEDIDFDGEALKKQLLNATHEFLVNRYGYDDDFVNDYIHIEVSEADNDCYKVQVRTELSYEESSELADVLNPFVEALDPNAYFDHLNSNIIEAYIRKDQSDDIVDEAVVAEWKTIVDNCNTVDEIRDNYRKLVDVRDNGEMTYGTISAIGDLFMARMDEIEGVNESLHEDGPEAYTMVKPNVKYKNFIGDTEVSYTDYNDAKAHFSDDYKIETYKDELQQFLNDNGEHFTVDVTTDGRLLIDISWGDWKHDHLRVDFLVSDFFNNKGLFVNSEKVTTEEDGSDTYSAEHYYTLSDFMFSQKPIEEAVEPTKVDNKLTEDWSRGLLIKIDATPESVQTACEAGKLNVPAVDSEGFENCIGQHSLIVRFPNGNNVFDFLNIYDEVCEFHYTLYDNDIKYEVDGGISAINRMVKTQQITDSVRHIIDSCASALKDAGIEIMNTNVRVVGGRGEYEFDEDLDLKESFDDETPYTKEQIEADLKSLTNNFTVEGDTLKCGFIEEAQYSEEILSQHYASVEIDKVGSWFQVDFKDPFNKGDSARGKKLRARGGFYGMPESVNEDWQKGDPVTLWWKDPDWHPTAPCYASCEYVGKTKDGKHKFVSDTYGWTYLLDIANKKVITPKGKEFEVHNDSGWLDRHLNEALNDYRFEVSCNDGPSKVIRTVATNEESAIKYVKNYYAQEHTTYADDRANKWTIRNLDESVEDSITRFKMEYYIDDGEKLVDYIYADNKEVAEKQLKDKVGECTITAMIPETVPAQYKKWDMNESKSIRESSYKKGDRVVLDNGMTGTVTKDFDWKNEDQVSVEIDGTGEMRYPRSEMLKDLKEGTLTETSRGFQKEFYNGYVILKNRAGDGWDIYSYEGTPEKVTRACIEDEGFETLQAAKAAIDSWVTSNGVKGEKLSETVNPADLTDCPECGDVSFDSKRGRCTKCNYREELDESKSIKESIVDKLTDEQLEKIDEIADRYCTSSPVSGDWHTEAAHECEAIANALDISISDAKVIMRDYLKFPEDELTELDESKSIKEGFSGITALADDCGKNTFKVSSRDIRFTFENEDDKTKFVNELLSSNIPHNELAFGVVSINKSAALDECKSIKEDTSKTSFTELKDIVEEFSELTGLSIYVIEPDEEGDSVELFCDEVSDIEGTGLIDVIEYTESGYDLDVEAVLEYLTHIGLYEPDNEASFPLKEGRMTDRYRAQVKKHFEDEIDSTDISHEIAEDGLSFTIVREDGTKLEFNAAEGYTTTKPIKESTETRTVGIYGDEVNGMSSVDEIVSYLKKKGLTVSDVEGDMEYGWEMNVTGNPRDLFFAITNTFGGYKSDSVDDFINRYAIDESVKTETIATNPKEGDGTEWFVGDNDGGRIYYSESDAKKAYNFLVKRGVKDAVMELITDEE